MTDRIEHARQEMVLELMKMPDYKPLKFKELCMLFDVSGQERESFKELLDKMIADGRIRIMGGRYEREGADLLEGIFQGSMKGFGFVRVEGRDSDIFIPASETHGAFHGDSVRLQLVSEAGQSGRRGARAEGRIVEILKRGASTIVGTFQKSKSYGFVVPDNRKIGRDIFIPAGKTGKAVNGHKVVVRITDYGGPAKNPEGEIIEILGHADDPRCDVLTAVRAFGIPDVFPEEVMQEVAQIPDHVLPEEMTGRRDLRDLLTVTIDGEDAKDLDDAVTLSMKGAHYILGVHIADVSHYVKEGSPLDTEALNRGTSVYLVNQVVPMLPHALSNGICSLNEGENRLAQSCIMELDEQGRIVDHEICESLIRVDHRMSYTQVSRILEGDEVLSEKYADSVTMFRQMKALSDLIRARRFDRGGIDFDFPESKILLDENDFPTEIGPYDRNPATKIIEDFMLMANETVAEDYFWQELPFLYRTHETPDEDRIRRLVMMIRNFGYHMNVKSDGVHPKEFQKLLGKIDGTPEMAMISRLVLRSMKQARYTTENYGHFGLAAGCYCHFTSPIRRYPDLMIHRIIEENLHGQLDDDRQSHYHKILPEIAGSTSSHERRADEAEREVVKKKKAQYMSRRIGQFYEGVVSGVTSRGLYVELANTCEGLVRLEDLGSDYYLFDENALTLTGEDTGRVFRLGDRLMIRVYDVDFQSSTVLFHIKKGQGEKESREARGRRHHRR